MASEFLNDLSKYSIKYDDLEIEKSNLEEIFLSLVKKMNLRGIHAIYRFEMARTFRTLTQSIASPVLSTVLYFIVFGSAIGSRMILTV